MCLPTWPVWTTFPRIPFLLFQVSTGKSWKEAQKLQPLFNSLPLGSSFSFSASWAWAQCILFRNMTKASASAEYPPQQGQRE